MPKHQIKSKVQASMSKSTHRNLVLSEGPKPSATSYSGPVTVKKSSEQLEIVNFSTSSTLTTTSSGSIATSNTVFSASGVTSTTDWSGYAALYQECRCVAMSVQFLPGFQNSLVYPTGSSTAGPNFATPLYLAKYHANATALASEDAAVNHMSRVAKPVNAPSSIISVKMKETNEASWSATSSPSIGVFGVKSFMLGFTRGATDVVNWGTYIVTYAVQFRIRVVSNTQFSTNSLLPHLPSTFPSLGSISASSDNKQKAATLKESKDEKSLSKPTVLGLPYDKPPLTHSSGQQRYVFVCSEPASPTQLPFPVKISSKSD